MKSIIYIFVFIILINKGFSQDYIPSVEPGRIWEIFQDYGRGVHIIHKYQITCDTIINSTSYKKVSSLTNIYIGSVREDVEHKKVYFFHKDSTQESLVADYALAIGEIFQYEQTPLELDSIKIEYKYGANRKVFYFNSYPLLIEGVGNRFYGIITDRDLKFTQNVTDNQYSCDALSTKIEKPSPEITIFPNPASHVIYINGLTNKIEVRYQLYSLTGQTLEDGIVKNSSIEIKDIKEHSVVLKLSENNSSFYNKILLINQ